MLVRRRFFRVEIDGSVLYLLGNLFRLSSLLSGLSGGGLLYISYTQPTDQISSTNPQKQAVVTSKAMWCIHTVTGAIGIDCSLEYAKKFVYPALCKKVDGLICGCAGCSKARRLSRTFF